jgi:hypothetical protein
MHQTYFKIQTGIPSREVLQAFYGPFDPTGVEPAELEKKQAEYEAKLAADPLKNPMVGPIVAIGYLHRDGTAEVPGVDVDDPEGEAALIRRFWAIFRRGPMAGWGIHAQDLHTIKVRSWHHKIPIPVTAIRPAGARRTGWIGFRDVRAEFDGGPRQATPLDKAAKFFGLKGEQASRGDFHKLWNDPEPLKRESARERLVDDLLQTAAIATAIGFDRDPPTRVQALGLAKPTPVAVNSEDPMGEFAVEGPTNFDIETAPGELADIKRIVGEFDPKNVKLGAIKDPLKIEAKITKARENYDGKLIKDSMLDPLLGRICAIGYKQPDGSVHIPELTESELLLDFWRRYKERRGNLQGWNILSFDLRWIIQRSRKHGIQVPPQAIGLAGCGYSKANGFVDLMNEFTGDSTKYLSIDEADKFFGGSGKNGDGAEFFRLWESPVPEERKLARDYLTNDVEMSTRIGANMGFGVPALDKPDAGLFDDHGDSESLVMEMRTKILDSLEQTLPPPINR